MWHANAYIIEKPASQPYFPSTRSLAHMRALAYTHMRIVRATGGRMRYVHYAPMRMLSVRVKRAYAYMRGWRAHNRASVHTRVPRPYIRVVILTDILLL